MLWSLDMDDFAGRFCGQGRYPLLRSLNLALGGVMYTSMSKDAANPGPVVTGGSIGEATPHDRDSDMLLMTDDLRSSSNVTCSASGGDSIHEIKADCRRYLRCLHGHRNLYTCRSGMRWKQAVMACVEWPQVECEPSLVRHRNTYIYTYIPTIIHM